MNKEQIYQEISDYFENEAGIDQEIQISDSLVEGGVIDSFDIVSLSVWLASRYGMKVSPLEVNLDNFDTIERIAAFIERKLS